MRSIIKERKGVAGLNIFLSMVAMLFMIGIIVMVFVIAGSKLQDSVKETCDAITVTNESLGNVTSGNYSYFDYYNLDDVACSITTMLANESITAIGSGNWTYYAPCSIKPTATSEYLNMIWNVSYTYTFSDDTDGSRSINDTKTSIKTATDFFPTFIVLGSMVVLVLLTVIIINSIRKTGITGEGA